MANKENGCVKTTALLAPLSLESVQLNPSNSNMTQQQPPAEPRHRTFADQELPQPMTAFQIFAVDHFERSNDIQERKEKEAAEGRDEKSGMRTLGRMLAVAWMNDAKRRQVMTVLYLITGGKVSSLPQNFSCTRAL